MPELKDRIPVLNDIVHRVVAEHSGPGSESGTGSRSSAGPVLSAETVDALVDTLHREFLDRVTRSLHEAIAREEKGLRRAIRAHLEVTLPEVIARHEQQRSDGGHEPEHHHRRPVPPEREHHEYRHTPDHATPKPTRSQRRKLRLPRKRKVQA